MAPAKATWPFGHALHLAKDPTRLGVAEKWAETLGGTTFEFQLGPQKSVLVTELGDVEMLKALRPRVIQRTTMIRDLFEEWAPSLFSAERPEWSVERRIISPAFSHARISSYLPTLFRVAHRFGDVIAQKNIGTTSIPINDLCQRFTMDVIALLAFGQDLNLLLPKKGQDEDPIMASAATVIPAIFKTMGQRLNAPVPWHKIPIIGDRLDGGAALKIRVKKLMNRVIDTATPGGPTLVDKFVEKSFDENITTRRLGGNVTGMFIAGSDTTSSTIQWMLKHLAQDIPLQTDARGEAKAIISFFEASRLSSEEKEPTTPDFASVLKMAPLLRSLFWEVLRVEGPVMFLGLTNPTDPVTINGVTCDPKEYAFFVPLHYLGTHGLKHTTDEPDPLSFNPRRWLDPMDSTIMRPLPPHLLPFGMGARICPGKDLAEVEALICVAVILSRFTMTLIPDDHKNVFRITMQPDRNIDISFTSITS